MKGYTINEQRLRENNARLLELQEAIHFVEETIGNKQLTGDETQGLLSIIKEYTRSFILLNQFDNDSLEVKSAGKKLTYEINHSEAAHAIEELKKDLIAKTEASDLFGRMKDESFKGILQAVVQTFGGHYLYPTVEEQAAHLLYFTIKNHPFIDGNKRIGSFLFIWFLERNKYLLSQKGKLKINDNALVALALLVAQSDPDHKETMIKLTMNLIYE